jgi:hypothetical protein
MSATTTNASSHTQYIIPHVQRLTNCHLQEVKRQEGAGAGLKTKPNTWPKPLG